MDEILKLIKETIAPGRMSPDQARDFLKDLKTEIFDMLNAMDD